MTIEEMGRKIIADSINAFQARLAAATDEEAADMLHLPVGIVRTMRAEAAERDAEWARIDAEAAADECDYTDDMDWEDMAERYGD